MSVNANLPLALASPSSGHRPCNHVALSLLVSAGLIRRQKRARASEATDDGEHAADINEQVDVLDSLPSISRNHLVADHIFSGPTQFNQTFLLQLSIWV